jgi:DNA mismatch repair ATPase MutS
MYTNNNFYHNEEAYQDLSIGDEIFNTINKTITNVGSKKLKNRLLYCSTNVDYLEQLALKNYSIQQDSLYRYDMEQYLLSIKELESSMDSWMQDICNDSLLFNWNIMNNRYFLTASNKLKFSSMLMIVVVYVLIYLCMCYYGFEMSLVDYTKGIIIGYYEFIKLMIYFVLSNRQIIEWTAITLTVMYVCYQIYNTYQSVNTCYEHYKLCNSFYVEYEKILKYIAIVKKMCKSEIYINTDNVQKSLKYLEYYFTDDVSLGFSLVTKLDTDSYVKHIDVLSNFVGKVDCQIMIANMLDYDEYTIPKFINAQFPVLHIEAVWNPLISYAKRIKNSLIMNVTLPNVMIITGPNKAGKSTFMRSVMTAIYLAQSLGISCCDKIALTPFIDIFTYINVPDCVGRESLFEAELNRCYNYIEKTESLRGFSIGIVDELFTGTNPKEGKAASYAILKRIADNPTNITILSTHYHDLLGFLNTERFMFNKFIAKQINNKFVFTYKIEDGISDQCIALELLKQRGFDKEIVDNALAYKKFDDIKNNHINNPYKIS